MFNIEDIKKLIKETEQLRDLYQQQLNNFKKTKPEDLKGDENLIADAKAQGTPLNMEEIFKQIEHGYNENINSFDTAINYWNGVLSGTNDNTL